MELAKKEISESQREKGKARLSWCAYQGKACHPASVERQPVKAGSTPTPERLPPGCKPLESGAAGGLGGEKE